MTSDSGSRRSGVVRASASGVWGRLSNLWRHRSIDVNERFVELVRSAAGGIDHVPISEIDAVGWQRGGLGARVWFTTSAGRRFVVGGLSSEEAALVVKRLSSGP